MDFKSQFKVDAKPLSIFNEFTEIYLYTIMIKLLLKQLS